MTDTRKRAEDAALLAIQRTLADGGILTNTNHPDEPVRLYCRYATQIIEQALIAERNMALEDAVKAIEECKSFDWWEEVKAIEALKVKQNE